MANDNLNKIWYGVVEDINDPIKSKRVRIRRLDQTPDRQELPTCGLPWSINVIGSAFDSDMLEINDFVYGNYFNDTGTLAVQGKYPGLSDLPAAGPVLNTAKNYYKLVWQHWPVALSELYKDGVPKDYDWQKLREEIHKDPEALDRFEKAIIKLSEEVDLPPERKANYYRILTDVLNDYSPDHKFTNKQTEIGCSKNENPGYGQSPSVFQAAILDPKAPIGTIASALQIFGSGAIVNLPLASKDTSVHDGGSISKGNGDPKNNPALVGSVIAMADKNRVHVCSISQATKKGIAEFVLLVKQGIATLRAKIEAYFKTQSSSPLIQAIQNKIRKYKKELGRITKLVKVFQRLITAIQELIKLTAEILKWLTSLPAVLAAIVAECAAVLIAELKSAIQQGVIDGVVTESNSPSTPATVTLTDRASTAFQDVQDQFSSTVAATELFFTEISNPSSEQSLVDANSKETIISRP